MGQALILYNSILDEIFSLIRWGTSARAKQHFGPLGYESGSTPIQRKTSFERSYNYALRTTRQFPPVTLGQLQLTIDLGRIDISKPIDMAALCASKAMFVDPEKNQFGFNLTHDVGLDTFSAKVLKFDNAEYNPFKP